MTRVRIVASLGWLAAVAVTSIGAGDAVAQSETSWPPAMRGLEHGTARVTGPRLLEIPPAVAAMNDDAAAPFVVAKTPSTVHVAFHGDLGPDAVSRRLWSSWGDICVARDGSVYVGIGDHGNDAGGDARCFLYRWDPRATTLKKIVDMNEVVPPRPGQPAWSKVHAKIDEGRDGKIYFSCTLNAGNAAGNPKYQWTEQLPGAQLYQYDPQTGGTITFASLPPKRCTATSLYDAQRNTWWCNLEAGGGDALYGLDLATKQVVYQSDDGVVGFNRNFALATDGSLYFNGKEGAILRLDPQAKAITPTGVTLPGSLGMRASTTQTKQGTIYGVTHGTGQLFRFDPAKPTLELLGPTWGKGEYTTVLLLSPDERFLYYLPGAHGKASNYGTPVVQYEIATRTRKVLAFLAPALTEAINYVPGGTYGVKLTPDGGTLYANLNGHAADPIRPARMKPNGFGLCSFLELQIPGNER